MEANEDGILAQPDETTQTTQTVGNPLDKVVVTDAEKENFFKAFLADRHYEETVSLFGGRLTVVFRSLSVSENDAILRQIRKDVDSGAAAKDEGYFVRLLTYRLAMSIVSINGEPFLPDLGKPTIPDGELNEVGRKSAALDVWPLYKLAGLQNAFKQFELKLFKLTQALDDPVFWKAAA